MKKSAKYAQRIRQLFAKLKKEQSKASLLPVADPMDQLLRGILSTFTSEARAEAALARLYAAVVDLNELRVTPISEIVAIIGVDYPSCRAAAEEVSRALNAVFNRIHCLDLGFIRTGSRKSADDFLDSLEGVGAHARATVILRCLGGHVIPVDTHMFAYLKRAECIPEDATVEQAQDKLTRQLAGRDPGGLYVVLKRYAATHAPRKPATARASRAAAAAQSKAARGKPEGKAEAAREAAATRRTKKKVAASKTAREAAAKTKRKKATSAKVASRRKLSKKPRVRKAIAASGKKPRSSKARKATSGRSR
ncbi:MAG: hypothetical protein JXQ75_07930 [Phycisphaerae bacterium]|nr:hypothetical protein [Phycisphaerae bacterium]